jgi:hypothetical protein
MQLSIANGVILLKIVYTISLLMQRDLGSEKEV